MPEIAHVVEFAIISIGAAVLAALQFRYRFFQYLFFLRTPLVHAAILMVLLPLAVFTRAFATLFVITPTQLAVVTFLLIFSTWAVGYAWGVVFVGAGPRFKLKFHQPDLHQENGWDTETPPNNLMGLLATERRRAYVLPIVLGAPIVAICWWRSPGTWLQKALAIGVGIAAAVAARELSVRGQERFRRWLHAPEPSVPAARLLNLRRSLLQSVYRLGHTALGGAFKWAFASGYADLADDQRKNNPTPVQERPAAFSHWRAAAFAVLALLVYVAGAFALDPSQRYWLIEQTPALAYALMVVTLLGLVLPATTFFFDFYRVPLAVVIVAILFMSYRYSDLDHYYEFAGPKDAVTFTPLEAPDFLHRWVQAHPQATQRPLVVIAASGGGSHSARWTTEVLAQLRTNPNLGERFFKSIVFVSAVSGGALGTMYAIERFDTGLPTVEALEKARDAASHSNVGALAWGMAYPDLVRKVFPRMFFQRPGGWGLFDARRDRGWALEQTWRSVLAEPSRPATLGRWADDARSWKKPAVVFNATLMETGERFLLSGLTIPNSRATQFAQRYSGQDLSVVTAVRLSAAFPYLSPIARPVSPYGDTGDKAAEFEKVAYHVADGGYYDGSGTLTAIEFIDAVLERYREQGGRKVVLVEIRTSIDAPKAAEGHTNWLAALASPLSTAYNAAMSSQTSRTALELDLLKRRWNNDDLPEEKRVAIESVVFHFEGTGTLPWHLSEDEQLEISRMWGNAANQRERARLENVFVSSP